MASPQVLRNFTSCYHTSSTNYPSFVIGSCKVIFLVLFFYHSVTTYSALDGTHVSCPVCLVTAEASLAASRPLRLSAAKLARGGTLRLAALQSGIQQISATFATVSQPCLSTSNAAWVLGLMMSWAVTLQHNYNTTTLQHYNTTMHCSVVVL